MEIPKLKKWEKLNNFSAKEKVQKIETCGVSFPGFSLQNQTPCPWLIISFPTNLTEKICENFDIKRVFCSKNTPQESALLKIITEKLILDKCLEWSLDSLTNHPPSKSNQSPKQKS